eukprot:5604912-Amphidinium_carterae.1
MRRVSQLVSEQKDQELIQCVDPMRVAEWSHKDPILAAMGGDTREKLEVFKRVVLNVGCIVKWQEATENVRLLIGASKPLKVWHRMNSSWQKHHASPELCSPTLESDRLCSPLPDLMGGGCVPSVKTLGARGAKAGFTREEADASSTKVWPLEPAMNLLVASSCCKAQVRTLLDTTEKTSALDQGRGKHLLRLYRHCVPSLLS